MQPGAPGQGDVISQLKSVIGVKIRISDRDDFVPGTRNRKVTISGSADAVQIAQVHLPHTSLQETFFGNCTTPCLNWTLLRLLDASICLQLGQQGYLQ